MKSLTPLFPKLYYDNGFMVGDKILPYYSFGQPDETAHWSDTVTNFIAEATRDHFIDRYNRRIALQAIDPVMKESGATYLDIGCSAGYMLEEARAAFPQADLFGSDHFSSGLLHCHEKLPSVPLFQMDIAQCQFKDNSFNAVTCLNVLEHVPNDAKALEEILRILKPNGILMMSVPASPHLYDLLDELHFHVRRYEVRDLRQKTIGAGFDLLAINHFGVLVYPGFYLQKKFNRLFYGKLSPERKEKKARQETMATRQMPWIEKLCNAELRIGRHLSYPFGIRIYTIARKPPTTPSQERDHVSG